MPTQDPTNMKSHISQKSTQLSDPAHRETLIGLRQSFRTDQLTHPRHRRSCSSATYRSSWPASNRQIRFGRKTPDGSRNCRTSLRLSLHASISVLSLLKPPATASLSPPYLKIQGRCLVRKPTDSAPPTIPRIERHGSRRNNPQPLRRHRGL